MVLKFHSTSMIFAINFKSHNLHILYGMSINYLNLKLITILPLLLPILGSNTVPMSVFKVMLMFIIGHICFPPAELDNALLKRSVRFLLMSSFFFSTSLWVRHLCKKALRGSSTASHP